MNAGDIVTIAGPDDISIGDTFSDIDLDVVLHPLEIEEPTVSMNFMMNNGPFAGKDGDAVTLRQIAARLEKEMRTNVALRVEETERGDALKVSGRGELHLAILLEEMRREGMELCVSPPEVILHRDEDGKRLEPMEVLTIDVPGEYQGIGHREDRPPQRRTVAMHIEPTGMVRLSSLTSPPAASSATGASSSPTHAAWASWPRASSATAPGAATWSPASAAPWSAWKPDRARPTAWKTSRNAAPSFPDSLLCCITKGLFQQVAELGDSHIQPGELREEDVWTPVNHCSIGDRASNRQASQHDRLPLHRLNLCGRTCQEGPQSVDHTFHLDRG